MPFCSKCSAAMISKLDLEDCSHFWDCPNLCVGTKPLDQPKQPKRKKRDRPEPPAPVIEILIQAQPREECCSSEAWVGDAAPADTNMQVSSALRFWKPTCSICGRDAEFSPFSESLDRCWIHGGPIGDDGQDEDGRKDLAWAFFLLLGALIRIAWHVARVAP